jgi:FtsZ-binding cell division protein ZapB
MTLRSLEEQVKWVNDELNLKLLERAKLKEDIISLTKARSDLKSEIEQKRSEMESVKAIATLLSSSNVEGPKKFRESVDMLINISHSLGQPISQRHRRREKRTSGETDEGKHDPSPYM